MSYISKIQNKQRALKVTLYSVLVIVLVFLLIKYRSLGVQIVNQVMRGSTNELAFVVKVDETESSSTSSRAANSSDGKLHVKLKVGSQKHDQYDASSMADATLETVMIDDAGEVTIEEHRIQYCRVGEGYIPYYLTFANAVEDKGVIKLPLHLGGDPYSLFRVKCRDNRRVCAFIIPRWFGGSASEEQYLSKINDSFDLERERSVETLNIPYIGALPGGGTMPGVGFGYVGVPPGSENMDDYLNRQSPVRDDEGVTDIDRYIFEFSFKGLGNDTNSGDSVDLGYYKTDFDHVFKNFAVEGTNPDSKYIYLAFPQQIKYFVKDSLRIARLIADRGAFNKSLGDYTSLRSPGESVVETSAEGDDCVGCDVEFTKGEAERQSSKMNDREYALKLMALSPFVIDISNQIPPEYLLEEEYRGKKPPEDVEDEFALKLVDKVTEEELIEGEPKIGTYMYINVRTECHRLLELEGLENIISKCVFTNISDILESIIESGDVDDDNIYCGWRGFVPPDDFLSALFHGELGAQQSMYINLGIPVISSLTLDRPDGKVVNRGITHSVVSQTWNELGLEPNSVAGRLNLLELFYVLDKVKGMDGDDLLKKGYMPNIKAYMEELEEEMGEAKDLESVKSLLREELDRVRFRKAPVIITMVTFIKLYPRISKSSRLYGFFNKPLGPYSVRVYTFLGNDLSALFRNVISIAAPLQVSPNNLADSSGSTQEQESKTTSCASNKYLNPYVEQFLVTLEQEYNYRFGEVYLKVREDGSKLSTEFEFYTDTSFEIPDEYLSLKDDADKIKECFPFMVPYLEE